jgi:fucose 4-O-acetylase-like acetyltransferase
MGAAAAVSSRDARVDALKGLAIICVVSYHAAGQYFRFSLATGVVYDPWAEWLRGLLFSFMLPLFAFMSGYVLGRPGGFKPKEYFIRRTVGLLVPYLAWETIYGPWRDKHPEMSRSVSAFVGYYVRILLDPHYEGRMWYLYVLWIALSVLGLMLLASDRSWVLAASVIVVYAIASFGPFHWVRWVYAFVVIGVLWRRNEGWLMPRMRAIGTVGVLGFVPMVLLCQPEPIALARLKGVAGSGWGLAVVDFGFPVLLIVTGLFAVMALVALSYHLRKPAEKALAYLGMLSLGIYVTHFHFVEMWRRMPAWFLPINVAIALGIAVALTIALGAWRVSATVLLGERWVRVRRPLGDVETETL